MGRPFMCCTGALGEKEGDHAIAILKVQMENVEDFPQHLI